MSNFEEDYIVGSHIIPARVAKHFQEQGFRLAVGERPDEKPHLRAFLLIEVGAYGQLLWALGEFDPDRATNLPRSGDFVICHYFDVLYQTRRVEPGKLAFWKPLERLNDLEFE